MGDKFHFVRQGYIGQHNRLLTLTSKPWCGCENCFMYPTMDTCYINAIVNALKLPFETFTSPWIYPCYNQPQVGRPKFRLETNSTVVWLYASGVSLIFCLIFDLEWLPEIGSHVHCSATYCCYIFLIFEKFFDAQISMTWLRLTNCSINLKWNLPTKYSTYGLSLANLKLMQ